MDTKKLEALLTAVELGSFTRAAEVLGYTQSGLTHMMNSLEKDIGFTVLLRGRSGVRLTPAGQRILPLVRDCLTSTAALEREISLINTHKEDSVRVRPMSPSPVIGCRRSSSSFAGSTRMSLWTSRWAA